MTDLAEQIRRDRARQSWPTAATAFTPPRCNCHGPLIHCEPGCARYEAARGNVATVSTITPPDPVPTVDDLSPFQRVELERILLDLDVARERLRKVLERPS